MPRQTQAERNWFDAGGEAYARFRPEYPSRLARWLAESSPSRELAVDVGCGNGQLATALADAFDRVIGCDPSADQIANARARSGVRYVCAPAEAIPLPDGSTSLVAAAQAAHWFELPAFYAEARRIARPGALVALLSYGAPRLEGTLQARFERFYHDEIGPWWPAERKLVDSGYRDIDFPFAELSPPSFGIRASWRLDEFLGYLATWSAVRRAGEAGEDSVLAAFANDASRLWGDPATRRPVAWPINMRVGST